MAEIITPELIPTPAQVLEVIKECLQESGVPPEAVDILPVPYNLISPAPVAGVPDQLLPLYVAVVKTSGMALFFPAKGPYGIYQRFRDKRVH